MSQHLNNHNTNRVSRMSETINDNGINNVSRLSKQLQNDITMDRRVSLQFNNHDINSVSGLLTIK